MTTRLDEAAAGARATERERAAMQSRVRALEEVAARVDATADGAFGSGLASFEAGEHGGLVLVDFVARFPDRPQAAYAQWWIRKARDRQRDFPHALAELPRVVAPYPARSATRTAR